MASTENVTVLKAETIILGLSRKKLCPYPKALPIKLTKENKIEE